LVRGDASARRGEHSARPVAPRRRARAARRRAVVAIVDEIRTACAEVAAAPEHVRIDEEALAAYADSLLPIGPIELGPQMHYLVGTAEDTAAFVLHARCDQLRHGLVPDNPAARRPLRLLHRGRGAEGALRTVGAVARGGAGLAHRQRDRRRSRAAPPARADAALRRGAPLSRTKRRRRLRRALRRRRRDSARVG